MNNYSFVPERSDLNFTPYGIISMNPSSGPAQGSTNIIVKGSGFLNTGFARCRFGVEGYYSVTEAVFVDSNTIVCPSPDNYIIPLAGQLPFSVPFAIAFIEDDYNPYTETTHFYSFYDNPEIVALNPKETKTSVIREVLVYASLDKPFSMPSATVVEEDIIDYSNSASGTVVNKKSFTYLPVACRFGRFGITVGKYVNRTLIKCITPGIDDDTDIAREDVELAIALNGLDFITNSNLPFTFIGPSSGSMIGYYLLLILLLIGLIVGISACLNQYWSTIQQQLNQLRNSGYGGGDIPHTVQRRLRYLEEEAINQKREEMEAPIQSQSQNQLQPQNSQDNVVAGSRGVAPPPKKSSAQVKMRGT